MTSHTTNQISHTLQSLLPGYASGNDGIDAFPAVLVNLAHSLLQRSRARVSSLKPAEEVARVWVVAEIACHRLKTRLNLPPIQSRPPCPPKVYKKLYAYLDAALKDEPPRRESRSTEKPADTTPSGRRDAKLQAELPVRSTPVRKRPGEHTGDTGATEALKNAVTNRGLKKQRFNPAQDELGEAGSGPEHAPAAGEEGDGISGTDEEDFVDADEFIEDDETREDNMPDISPARNSGPSGPGSLMESRFDWLSENRRRDFVQWKAGILKQIDGMDRAGKRVRTQKAST